MLFTRECDYAIRIFRALADGALVNVQEISQMENLSVSITYKIARKLEKAGYIKSYRGTNGGYCLNTPLAEITLYDVFITIDRDMFITSCTKDEFKCSRNKAEHPCMVHKEFMRLQKMIEQELKSKSLLDIMNG